MKEYYFYAEQMCVGYQGKCVVRNIELALQKGEILTLIGGNGAGKSTVLKSIAGQLRPFCGTACLDGTPLFEINRGELAKKMSVVFTEQLRTELMTCEDVVATGRYPYTGRFGILSEEDWQIVRGAMELIQVREIGKEDFRKVSDGQRQRVMLARAICQEPEILILDEPISYLDIRHKLEFVNTLQELQESKGLTVIMSMHELDLAKIVSDKILCLKDGYVLRYGTPEEVFESGFIGKLFGLQEENFIHNKKLLSYIRQIGNYQYGEGEH